MSNSNSSKQVLLSVIGVAILVVAVVGVSFAFFNYTRTGSANTVRTGTISFTSSQSALTITTMFPIKLVNGEVANGDLAYTDEAVVTINGSTTYADGMNFRVSVASVTNHISDAIVDNPSTTNVNEARAAIDLPISVLVSTEDTSNITNLVTNNYTNIATGYVLASGTIPYNTTITNAKIKVRAYLDGSQIAISDTYDGTESDNMGTTTNWVNGRYVLTTDEWNNISGSGAAVSFKIVVEAVQAGGEFQQPLVTPTPVQP